MNVENMCNVDRELRGGKRAVIVFQRRYSRRELSTDRTGRNIYVQKVNSEVFHFH